MSGNSSGIRSGLFFLGAFLAIGLILSVLIFTQTIQAIKLSNQTIRVKGYAERMISSNRAVWQCRYQTRSEDLVLGYQEIEENQKKVIAYLESKGINIAWMEVFAVQTEVLYKKTEKGYNTNEIEGYILVQSIIITSDRVFLINQISNEITALMKEGIQITSYNPQFLYTKIDDLKIEMLGDATKNAHLRAAELAENSGGKVGGLRSARQGVFQITPVYSTDVSDYGQYDTTTIDKMIKAVVTMEYSIIQ